MKLYQQFDLNFNVLKTNNLSDVPKKLNDIPGLVEKLTKELLEKGYDVIKERAQITGLPQSITIIKDFRGPFATQFSTKINEDFNIVSKALGIEKLFE